MASKAVAERPAPSVPALIQTPALTITAEDVALPRLYIGQYMTKAVQDQIVKPGSVFSAMGQDDPDPQVLWQQGDDGGVRFHVVALRKGKSWSAGPGEELQLFDFDDPSAPPDAWVTYNYTLFLPDYDSDVPYKLLLTRTGRPAALQINTVLKKSVAAGPAWVSAFEVNAAPRENNKGKYFVARVSQVEAKAADVDAATSIAVMLSPAAPEVGSTGEQPAI